MAVTPFSAAQITRLAHLLDGPTGSELRRDLREARLPVGVESTKWRMLRESFELGQRQSGSATPSCASSSWRSTPRASSTPAISARLASRSTRCCCSAGSSSRATDAWCP